MVGGGACSFVCFVCLYVSMNERIGAVFRFLLFCVLCFLYVCMFVWVYGCMYNVAAMETVGCGNRSWMVGEDGIGWDGMGWNEKD